MNLSTLKNCYRMGLDEYFANLEMNEPKHVIDRIAADNRDIDYELTGLSVENKVKDIMNKNTVGDYLALENLLK